MSDHTPEKMNTSASSANNETITSLSAYRKPTFEVLGNIAPLTKVKFQVGPETSTTTAGLSA